MLGFGILALLGAGVALSMSTSSGGDVDVDENVSAPDPLADDLITYEDGDSTVTVTEIDFEPAEDADPDQVARIEAFIAELEANPTETMIQDFEDFIRMLEEEEAAEAEQEMNDAETGADDTPDQGRPPMGEEYRDPLIVAEELEAQRILDEIAAEEARTPPNLVTVTDGDGEEVPDEGVLGERDESASEDDPAYTVTAPSGANSINVNFDAEHTFAIEYNADTASVTAGLNSTISGPSGWLDQTISDEANANGVNVRTLLWEREYYSETDITLSVASDHIGAQIAQIDLTNPNDTLRFEFDDDVSGELHLVFLNNDGSGDADTITTSRAFVIHTGAGAGSPTASDIETLLENGGSMNDVNILAEVFLGEDSIDIDGDPQGTEAYEIRITNFVNDTPVITSNVDWASETELDATGATGGGAEGGVDGERPDGEDDISGMIEGIGLNPDFFGF